MIYDVTLEQPVTRYRRATLRVEATDATAAYKAARDIVQESDWLTDPQEYTGEYTDVEASCEAGWTHSFRDESVPEMIRVPGVQPQQESRCDEMLRV